VEMPPKVEVDTDNLLHHFHQGFERVSHIWEQILTTDVYRKLKEIGGLKEREFNFPTDLWARVLFDTAVSYGMARIEPDEIMDSLIPLYFGRTLSFVKRTRKMSIKQAEEAIENDCETFEMTKPYLLQRWRNRGTNNS
jgi:hypothetical protein